MKLSPVKLHAIDVRSVKIHGCLDTRESREPRKDRRWWQTKNIGRRQLLSTLVYTLRAGNKRFWFDAPAGFRTNYYSYPLGGRSLLGQNEAAVGHDRLYDLPVVWDEEGLAIGIDRESADKIFVLSMQQVGAPKLLREIRYAVVRLGGQAAWDYCRSKHRDFSPYRVVPDVVCTAKGGY